MFPLKSFCGFENNSPFNLTEGEDSIKTLSERKSTEACKSHKEAERRRRQRINAHLSTLRSLLPNTTKVLNQVKKKYKYSITLTLFNLFFFFFELLAFFEQTDKASLLAEVVHHVRELRRQVEDVARRDVDGCCSKSQPELESWPFPGERDEAALSLYDKEAKLLKATVCCEDRPGLNHDLNRVIRSVQARVVRAEMTTVGGRTKSVVVMQWGGDVEEIGPLERALKDVVANRVSVLAHGEGSKRARVIGSDNENGSGFLVDSV